WHLSGADGVIKWDTQAPDARKNLSVVGGEDTISLSWSELETSEDVAGFQVLCRRANGAPFYDAKSKPKYLTAQKQCGMGVHAPTVVVPPTDGGVAPAPVDAGVVDAGVIDAGPAGTIDAAPADIDAAPPPPAADAGVHGVFEQLDDDFIC